MSDSKWFVVHTKPRQEKTALENLERQGYHSYLPDLIVKKYAAGRWVERIEPLFYRYLFVYIDTSTQDMSPIRSTTGVTGLVRFSDKPLEISADFIEQLRSHANEEGHHFTEEPTFTANEALQIQHGPFAGLPAIYKLEKGQDRAIVLINFLGSQKEIVVNQNDLDRF
ncbi:MAG: transcriptional activator RfaH [Bacteroidetes Order II. Incertae sedis bacterium]|jgi:transcriptional antiterminator RfaH|nr:transcriptional activator RfaH [Bacteroidetes Order II. bacterium]